MDDKLEELREVVSYAIENNLELDVKSVKVSSFLDDGQECLKIEITLKLTPQKLPRDIIYSLVKSASNAIRGHGESRFPVVLPHLAEKQLLAARS